MRLLPLAISALLIAACSGSTTTIGGEDPVDGSTGGDGATGGGDGGRSGDGGGGGRDASGGDANNGNADAGSPGNDATTEGQVIVTINVTDFAQSCQPVVAEDPVQMRGKITVQNNTKSSVGPFAVADGAFLTPSGAPVATYKLSPASIPVLGPGASGTTDIQKIQPSMVPANGCQTLACNNKFVVQVTLTAPNIPTYNAKTVPIAIGCSF